ncbi:MAG: HAD hydrolase-like protein [Eubacteriales bacterium]|nr:HAD hydrolase-like protein [Eubacteriales bacterium]
MKLSEYKKKKDFLVCVDSDGCAMDTMDIKHIRCFGPCMVKEWGLEQWQDEILKRWNEINLYTMTRGINRFKGLSIALQEIHTKYTEIEDLDSLVQWVDNSAELSNDAIQREIEVRDSQCLRKALSWSKAVNASINQLPDEVKLPFEGVKEALAYAQESADVAIVSSANPDAVLEEWERYGLLEHTDIVLAQDAGSKAFCIGELLKAGYSREHVLMCGDAPGDLDAARKNGVFYYPILVRREKESWKEFREEAVSRLTGESYGGEYQQKKIDEFLENLK